MPQNVIGEIGLKSKFINSEYKKPLCVDVDDVKINRIHDENANLEEHEVQEHLKVENCATSNDNKNRNDIENVKWTRVYQDGILRLFGQYFPPVIMMTLKFLEVRIKNLSTTLLNRDKGPMISITIPNIELLFDGFVARYKRTLLISLALQHIKSKFIPYNKQNPSRKPRAACLAEIIFDINLKSEILWQDKHLLFESQSVSLCNTQITFYGGLFDIIEHEMLHTKGGLSTIENSKSNNKLELVPMAVTSKGNEHSSMEKLIDAITPHTVALHVEQVEVKSLDKHSSFHYHLLLQNIDVTVHPKHGHEAITKLSNLRIYTPNQEVLFLKELTLETRQDGKEIKTIMIVETLDIIYNHEDIYGWFLKIFTAGMKSSRRELIIKAIEMGNQRMIEFYHSEFVQNIFKEIILQQNIEMRHISILLELDDQISSIIAKKIRFRLTQLNDKFRNFPYADYTMDLLFKNRHWKVDMDSDTMCWFMGSKNPYSNKTETKQAHERGCALYLGNTFTRISSDRFKDAIKFNFRANTFRVEYSYKFTKFVEETARSCKSFTKLFSQLKKKDIVNDNKINSSENLTLKLEEFLDKISINFKIVDFSSFFINRHDVCIFVNISTLSSTENLSYLFDMLKVSTIDYRKYDGLCDLSDITNTYISTSLLKVNLEKSQQYQLCVDFAEKFECSWNAHFIRHSLSIVRDFRRFKANIEEALEIKTVNTQITIPSSLPLGFDIKKLRNISVKHTDVNIDKLMYLINELSGEKLCFYNYF
ncbi:protein hobbit-like isoform X2 [Chironomus tepperi]|uniref:protein hobbit-like isoform X2 n=1 Tax=Chironomus tepperi TaxID=113505 RepID=UPI00391FC5C6